MLSRKCSSLRGAGSIERLTTRSRGSLGSPVACWPIAAEGPATRALSSLNRLDQEVLLLVAWDGLDRAQAARVLGITTGLFSVRLHRARRRLKRALAAQEQEIDQRVADPPAVEVL
jgi:predicted DNA-binding protein (UPF0251 family)